MHQLLKRFFFVNRQGMVRQRLLRLPVPSASSRRGLHPPLVHGLPTRCQFHQRFTSSFYACRSQKRKKDCQVISVFFRFWDLLEYKLLVKRWWNRPCRRRRGRTGGWTRGTTPTKGGVEKTKLHRGELWKSIQVRISILYSLLEEGSSLNDIIDYLRLKWWPFLQYIFL